MIRNTTVETDALDPILAAIERAEEVPAPADDEQLALERRNDYGNARRLITRFGYDLIFVEQLGWQVWDGKRWRTEDGEAQALIRAHQTAEAIFDEASTLKDFDDPEPEDEEEHEAWLRKKTFMEEQKKKLYGWALSSGNKAKCEAMITTAAPYLLKKHDDFDLQPWAFNVPNGTLRLDEGVRLYPHARGDYITKCAAVDYDTNADAPKWREFVNQVLPEQEVALFTQKWLGYCLTGDISEQKVVQFEGQGANGKSTLLEVVARVLGDYSVTTPIETFLHQDRKNGSGPSPDIARLPGARLVRASEPEPGSRLSESQIKQFTGGEKITARKLQRDFFEFSPQGKLTLSVNIRPVLVGKDHGIRRRILVVPFRQTFTSGKGTKVGHGRTLVDELCLEGPGILNWLLDGFRMWWEDGLGVPEDIKAATTAYFSEMDPIGSFVLEACEKSEDPNDKEAAADLFSAYKRWCKDNNEDEKSQTAFGRRMSDLGIKVRRSNSVSYRTCVRLRPEWRQDNENFEEPSHVF
ncbi:MAG: phage/plasmid primase, P4 family [Pseudomonadota bacterium]